MQNISPLDFLKLEDDAQRIDDDFADVLDWLYNGSIEREQAEAVLPILIDDGELAAIEALQKVEPDQPDSYYANIITLAMLL